MRLGHRVAAIGCCLVLASPVHADKQVIRRVVKRHIMRILACYEQHDLHAPRLVMSFTIGTSGRVTSAMVTGGTKPLQACVLGVFKRMTFPKPKDVIKVTYPLQICTAGS
jgi:hypothetical protein